MVEYYQNKLCIYGGWLFGEGGIMSQSNYRALTTRGHLQVLRNGCRNTPALVDFESMPARFKQAITDKLGNVYQFVKENQLVKYIAPDAKALDFFRAYTFGENNDRTLPEDAQLEYYNNVIIMNAVNVIFNDRKARRKALGGKTTGIWEELSRAVNELSKDKYPHALPGNYRRLKEKLADFKKESYSTFIHKGYCNKNTEKLNDEVKLWILAKWANNIERVTSEEDMLRTYNNHAAEMRKASRSAEKTWQAVKSVNTIHNFLYSEGIKQLWWGARYGELKAKEKFIYQHSTLLPTMRDSLWYSDGTKLNYYYLTEDGKIETTSVYEVMDVYSEVWLGYVICKNEDYLAQHESYKMALQFAGNKPYQISYDGQGGHKKLDAVGFLKSLAHLAIKTTPYNGKSKTIESAFGRYQAQYLKKDWFFTGQNITAKDKESRANTEFILANKENLPSLQEVKDIYKKRRDEWNNAVHPKATNGETRMEMYLASQNPKAVKLTIMDMVDLFCVQKKEAVRVTAYGIGFKHNGKKVNYMVYSGDMPDLKWLSANVDKKYIVKHDPTDMSRIHLYRETARGLEYVCMAKEKVEIHRGIQEQEEWESSYRKAIDSSAKDLRIENRDKMDEILEKHNLLPEQNGLNSPAIKGVESSRKQKNTPRAQKRKKRKVLVQDIAQLQKNISNAVEIGDIDQIDDMLDTVGKKHKIDIYNRM